MKYLLLFASTLERLSFREHEMRAILEMRGLSAPQLAWVRNVVEGDETPFMEVDLPTEADARFLASRSITLKGIFEPWGTETSDDACLEAASAYPEDLKAPYISENSTFKLHVVCVGRHVTEDQRAEKIQKCFKYMQFQGKVAMDGAVGIAHTNFWFLEDAGKPTGREVREGVQGGESERVNRRWFAREIARGQRGLLATYDLKRRPYLCSTSLPAELAFIAANFAHCRKGTLVLDNFCGSASLLVAAAHFGSHVIGGDIDARVLRGKEASANMPAHCRFAKSQATVQCEVRSSFVQYGLASPELVLCDGVSRGWRRPSLFDAIICDPPYGVRAGARKPGATVPCSSTLGTGGGSGGSRVAYPISELISDLLEFAAEFLTPSMLGACALGLLGLY